MVSLTPLIVRAGNMLPQTNTLSRSQSCVSLTTTKTTLDNFNSRVPQRKTISYCGRSNDVLADTISRIRNGYFRSFEQITVVDSNQTRKLLDALSIGGYIHTWYPLGHSEPITSLPNKESGHISQIIEVHLKYFRNIPAIRGIQQISTPGNRSYFSKKRILQYSQEQNWGESKTLFLSTKEGIITHHMLCASGAYHPEQTLSAKRTPAVGVSMPRISVGGGEALCLVW